MLTFQVEEGSYNFALDKSNGMMLNGKTHGTHTAGLVVASPLSKCRAGVAHGANFTSSHIYYLNKYFVFILHVNNY